MRVETLEILRCPAPHEPSALVTVAYDRHGDRIIEGMLGCSVCGAEYALHEGIALLSQNASLYGASQRSTHDVIDAMHLAALLALTETGARVALCGIYATVADDIEQIADAHCLAINAGAIEIAPATADRVQVDRHRAMMPFASASLRGLVVDDEHVALLHDAARVVRVGGRVVAPGSASMPPDCRELARDERVWVAEVYATPPTLIPLRTAPRSA